ncbi:MAG: hypothetical protein PHV11_08475 [Candidatus Bipolaricaulis sp.]|nr:hypothetical protein [Candidatus Bipolaricaulis sp.]
MYPFDIIKVKYYRMLGESPDPETDERLGECDVRIWETTAHLLPKSFGPGQYKIYTVGLDRFGNIIFPFPHQVITFEVTG